MSYRIWIDVTDFLRWKGAFTGFQRIQFNVAKQYIENGRDVAYFVYDEPARAFREVAFDLDAVARDGIIGEPSQQATQNFKARVKSATPASIKRVAKKILKTEARKSATASSPFTKNDVVLVLGGIWHGTFATDMAHEKTAKQFTFVHIVHDMIPVVCPQYVVEDLPKVFSDYKNTIFRIADGLIINSESSRRDAESFMTKYRIKSPKQVVFRIADEAVGEHLKPVKKLVGKEFILSVGSIEVRKNHALLYYAYKQAAREGVDLPLMVIAGRIGWLTDDIRYMITHDPDTKDKILLLTGMDNNQLAWLFTNCLYTMQPAYYEGWGMPVAESLSYGKVCLSSDTSSLTEIAPGLVEYYSPYNSEECLRQMQKYLNKQTRVQREKEIRKTYKQTSWKDMYTTISTFIDALHSSR